MNPTYNITLKLLNSISEKIGEINANHLSKQSPQLRKLNEIKNNTLLITDCKYYFNCGTQLK